MDSHKSEGYNGNELQIVGGIEDNNNKIVLMENNWWEAIVLIQNMHFVFWRVRASKKKST